MVLFHSTNGQAPAVNLREALLTGQAPDRGLYLPQAFPTFTTADLAGFARQPYHKIAFEVLRRFTAGVIEEEALAALCQDA